MVKDLKEEWASKGFYAKQGGIVGFGDQSNAFNTPVVTNNTSKNVRDIVETIANFDRKKTPRNLARVERKDSKSSLKLKKSLSRGRDKVSKNTFMEPKSKSKTLTKAGSLQISQELSERFKLKFPLKS